MIRRLFLMSALAILAGCSGGNPAKTRPYSKFTKTEIENELASRLQLREVKLTDQGGGKFSGTGKTATGEVHQLEVTQSHDGLQWEQSYRSADGKSSFKGGGGIGP
jgi:hypothetical protein